jgi:signal peptidase I
MRMLDRSLSRLPRPARTIVDWAVTILLACIVVLLFQAQVAKPYRIPSPSMEPTLHCARPADGCRGRFSDRVIVNRLVYRLHGPGRGDIIVFEATPRVRAVCGATGTFVKRVIGLPGDRVEMRGGQVLIDGSPLREPYVLPPYRGRETGRWGQVPRGAYFVLGDNRPMSCDSRRWGFVARDKIIGRADVTYWPPRRIGRP